MVYLARATRTQQEIDAGIVSPLWAQFKTLARGICEKISNSSFIPGWLRSIISRFAGAGTCFETAFAKMLLEQKAGLPVSKITVYHDPDAKVLTQGKSSPLEFHAVAGKYDPVLDPTKLNVAQLEQSISAVNLASAGMDPQRVMQALARLSVNGKGHGVGLDEVKRLIAEVKAAPAAFLDQTQQSKNVVTMATRANSLGNWFNRGKAARLAA